MPEYKNVFISYENTRQADGSKYLTVKNVSGEPVVIKDGETVYLNKTPKDRLEQYPTAPHYSKSVKVED
jgi:hypothetical protein